MHDDERLVTIATFTSDFEASLARGALEAIGVAAVVPTEKRGSFHGMYGGGPTPASLMVFERDVERASVELRRLQIRVVKSREDGGE